MAIMYYITILLNYYYLKKKVFLSQDMCICLLKLNTSLRIKRTINIQLNVIFFSLYFCTSQITLGSSSTFEENIGNIVGILNLHKT